MLIDGKYLNLIVARKSIHERKDDTSNTIVNDLIDMRGRKVVFWESFVQVSEINTDYNGCRAPNMQVNYYQHTEHMRFIVNPRKSFISKDKCTVYA